MTIKSPSGNTTNLSNDGTRSEGGETERLLAEYVEAAPSYSNHQEHTFDGVSHYIPPAPTKSVADARARVRFWRALICGFAIWLLAGLIFGITGVNYRKVYDGVAFSSQDLPPPPKPTPFPPSIPGESKCLPLPSWSSSAEKVTFTLTLTSYEDALSLYGEGWLSGGNVNFVVDESIHGHEAKAEVGVKWQSWWNGDEEKNRKWLELVSVCKIEKKREGTNGKQQGVWIYTPKQPQPPIPMPPFQLSIIISLPPSLPGLSLLSISGSSWSTLFKISSLVLDHQPISELFISSTSGRNNFADGFTVSHANLESSSGGFKGKLSVSESLEIESTSGEVKLDLDIEPYGSARPLPVSITSTSGAISLNYLSQPLERTLETYISSTSGSKTLSHSSNFTGSFDIETTSGKIETNFNKDLRRNFWVFSQGKKGGKRKEWGSVEWKKGFENGSYGESSTEVVGTSGNALLTF